jgi:hypothetical protein
MRTALIGLFDTYGQAEGAVLDLETAGIVGEEVEVISDVDRDLRAEALGVRPHDGLRERIARAFHGLGTSGVTEVHDDQVHDDPGEMPNYIGEQEFYASHVRQEGAVMVVRVPSKVLVDMAEAILKEHGSKTRDGKAGVLIVEEDDRPRQHVAGSGA